MINASLREAANRLYTQVKAAQANQAQCRLLQRRVQKAFSLLEQSEDCKPEQSPAATLTKLKDWLEDASTLIASFADQKWYASFHRLTEANGKLARFGELNTRLTELMSALGVGMAFQESFNQQEDQQALQEDMGTLVELLGSLAQALDASKAEPAQLRRLLLEWKESLQAKQDMGVRAAIVASGAQVDDQTDLSQTSATAVDVDVPQELMEDDATARRLRELVNTVLPQVVTAYIVGPGGRVGNANLRGASAQAFRFNVRSRASAPAPSAQSGATQESVSQRHPEPGLKAAEPVQPPVAGALPSLAEALPPLVAEAHASGPYARGAHIEIHQHLGSNASEVANLANRMSGLEQQRARSDVRFSVIGSGAHVGNAHIGEVVNADAAFDIPTGVSTKDMDALAYLSRQLGSTEPTKKVVIEDGARVDQLTIPLVRSVGQHIQLRPQSGAASMRPSVGGQGGTLFSSSARAAAAEPAQPDANREKRPAQKK